MPLYSPVENKKLLLPVDSFGKKLVTKVKGINATIKSEGNICSSSILHKFSSTSYLHYHRPLLNPAGSLPKTNKSKPFGHLSNSVQTDESTPDNTPHIHSEMVLLQKLLTIS